MMADEREIYCETLGKGPPLVLLHPFTTNHNFWCPLAPELAKTHRLFLPDFRGHGASLAGPEPITMAQHCADLERILDSNHVKRAIFFGVSMGGYILFEFWRRSRERVQALILCDTRAQADAPDERNGRLQDAGSVLRDGTEKFWQQMMSRLVGETTRSNQPGTVAATQALWDSMRPEGVAGALRGLAERADSVATLKSINVPTLIIVGEEDTRTPPADAELMHREIRGSAFARIPRAGHFAALEQPEAVLAVVQPFLQKAAAL